MRRRRVIAVLAIAIFLGIVLLTGAPPRAQEGAAAVARGRGGAVASVDARATEVGIEVLQAGGNAIDAAVAAAAALGVVEPFSAGVGGGDFMVIYLKDADRVITLDGREQAPASASVDMFNDPNNPGELLPFSPDRISTGLAVGVPGTPLTWAEALSRYGTISLAEALEPAIAIAEDGFEVDTTFVTQLEQNQERFGAYIPTRSLYLANGLPEVGSTFRNPDLAKTYRLLVEQGVNAFYRGEIAQAIVETVQNPPAQEITPFAALPGGMTLDDLDEYHVQVRPPVATDYRGYTIYGMGLPSSGGVTGIQTLNLAEGFDLATLDRAQALHAIIESERLAYADRSAFLGDPEYVDVPLAGLLSEEYTAERRSLIENTAPPEGIEARTTAGNPLPYQTDPSPSMTTATPVAQIGDHEGLSTTHLTVADRFGNVVSYTLTIESTGGSGIVVPGYGFLLNNELTDFDPESPHPNTPEPGKRPRSSMSPTIAFAPDGQVIAFGSPGGSTIITTVLGIAFNVFDFDLPIDEAIAAPRISQRNGGVTQVDSGFETSELGLALTELGHVLEPVAEIGAATGIVINPDGTMIAAAEPTRRGGGAAQTVEP
ncbi:gamma-glutamyltransferase [Cyanobacteria bacterium FACHB-471]|nr:gamma-glutamyltransferase [Cyanobacteria bacterium FACHB-471]